MTLFARASPDETVFGQVIDGFFGGELDRATLHLLQVGDDPGAPS